MSYDVTLIADGAPCTVGKHAEGGTYVADGTTLAELNITYNYAEVYRIFEFSVRDLDQRRAGDCIQIMEAIVAKCGTSQFENYWAPTPGNAGQALAILLSWARQHPDAIFEVS